MLDPGAVVNAADLLLLAVPDDAIADVAGSLRTSAGQFVVHLCGAHGVGVLAAAAPATPVALHPPMTFTGTAADLARIGGITFTATAPDAARPVVEQLVEGLGAGVQWIAEDRRAAYHAGLVHGGNHLVTLLVQATEVLRGAGLADPAGTVGPLMAAMLDNALRVGHGALTGPVARGDVQTVRAHLASLSGATRASYVVLAGATTELVAADGRIDAETAGRLREALDEEMMDR